MLIKPLYYFLLRDNLFSERACFRGELFAFKLGCACLIKTNSNNKLNLKQQSLMFHGLISKMAYYLEGFFAIFRDLFGNVCE